MTSRVPDPVVSSPLPVPVPVPVVPVPSAHLSLRVVCSILNRILLTNETTNQTETETVTESASEIGNSDTNHHVHLTHSFRLTPELLRRCKHTPPPSAVSATSEMTEERIRLTLWRYSLAFIRLNQLEPFTHEQQLDITSHAGIIRTIEEEWNRVQKYEDEICVSVSSSLHRLGYHGLCCIHHDNTHTPTIAQAVHCRRQLLAIGWLMGQTRIFERFTKLMASQAKFSWFAPNFQRSAVVANRRKKMLSCNIPIQPSAPTSSIYAQSKQPVIFPQPLLPSSPWDSAASFHTRSSVHQSDEWRLLQQMREEEETTSIIPSSGDRPRKRISTALPPMNSNRMCLPPPNESSVIADETSLAGTLAAGLHSTIVSPSALHSRLHHRLHQCISTQGKVLLGMKKFCDLSEHQSRLLTQLQLIQRHPSLRRSTSSSATTYSPFELQLLHSHDLRASIQTELSSWLSGIESFVSVAPVEFDSYLQVWWQWMASVAAVEKAARRAEAEEQRNSRTPDRGGISHKSHPPSRPSTSSEVRSPTIPTYMYPQHPSVIHPSRSLWSNHSSGLLVTSHLIAPIGHTNTQNEEKQTVWYETKSETVDADRTDDAAERLATLRSHNATLVEQGMVSAVERARRGEQMEEPFTVHT